MLSKLKRPILALIIIFFGIQIFDFFCKKHVFQNIQMYEQSKEKGNEKDDSRNEVKSDLYNVFNEGLNGNSYRKKVIAIAEKPSSTTSTSSTTTPTSTRSITSTTTTTTTTSSSDSNRTNTSTITEKKTEVNLSATLHTSKNVTDATQAKFADFIRLWKVARSGIKSLYDGRDLLKDPTFDFDPNFKNPCWFEKKRLRCLPYVYVIGVKKCGTSDLFYRLTLHPDFIRPGFKEAQWFARKRFEYGRFYDDINTYVDMFRTAASKILRSANTGNDTPHNYVHVTGEGSPSNLHLNTHWKYLPGNENMDEPKYVILDYIRHFIPEAKIIIVFRDPIDRLYSDYYYEYGKLQETNRPNPHQFHQVVSKGVQLYQECFKQRSVRSCVYEPSLYEHTRIQIQLGIYYIYWQELTRVFPREQILVLQNKNLRDKAETMRTVYSFLDSRDLRAEEMNAVVNKKETNTRRESFKNEGPMLNETLDILKDFYQPFNQLMSSLTGDSDFLYG